MKDFNLLQKIEIWVYIFMSITYIIHIFKGNQEKNAQEHYIKALDQVSKQARISGFPNSQTPFCPKYISCLSPTCPGFLLMFLILMNDTTITYPFIQATGSHLFILCLRFQHSISTRLCGFCLLKSAQVHPSPYFPLPLSHLFMLMGTGLAQILSFFFCICFGPITALLTPDILQSIIHGITRRSI